MLLSVRPSWFCKVPIIIITTTITAKSNSGILTAFKKEKFNDTEVFFDQNTNWTFRM